MDILQEKTSFFVDYVEKKIMNHELCLNAIKNNGEALQYVNPSLIDYDLCLEAVKN